MALVAILDVDGTLVDTNYHHTIAWYRAFRAYDKTVPLWTIHRHIGMGGDQLVPALVGDEFEKEHGDAVREEEGEHYGDLIDEVRALPGARDLIERLKEGGHSVVLASSATEEDVEHYIDLLDVRELADSWTTSADVEATKPAPDLVEVAMKKAEGSDDAVMVGDSTFDCESAGRAGIPTLGLLTGGFSERELLDAGAEAVFESAATLLAGIDDTPFAR